MRRLRRAFGLSTLIILLAAPAWAHAFGRPYDLPIPLSAYLAGAGTVVVLSFIIAALALRLYVPALNAPERGARWPWPIVWQIVCVALFALVISAGLAGPQSTFKSITPLATWVVFWAGLSLVSGFVGDAWPVLNPWAALHRGAEALVRRSLSLNLILPAWLGVWPAVGLFLAFAWCELLWEGSGHPHDIAWLLIAYSAVTWTGMVLVGRQAWLGTGEIFAIAFAQFGAFAPISIRCANPGYRITLRPYAVGLLRGLPTSPSRAAFLIAMLATVTFDGVSETPAWGSLLRTLSSDVADATLIATAGLIALPVTFGAVFILTIWLCRALAQDQQSLLSLAGFFVPTLLPIALAYHLAHNLSFLLLGLQYILPPLSDPFGLGWNLFGTHLYLVNPSLVSAKLIWTVAVIAIVAGHAVAVYLAHVVALNIFAKAAAIRSQLPMLVLMVAYTMISLWILAQPITNARTGG